VEVIFISLMVDSSRSVVMMVVQEGEKNASDQRHIEYLLWERHRVALVRRSLQDIAQRGKFDSQRNFSMHVFFHLSSSSYSSSLLLSPSPRLQ